MEKQLRNIFDTYAQACGAALKSADPIEQILIAAQKQAEQVNKVTQLLLNQEPSTVAPNEVEEDVEYGVGFDPDAAEK